MLSSQYISGSACRWRVALAGGVFIIGLAPLADGDLWWHLAAAREIVREAGDPRTRELSSSAVKDRILAALARRFGTATPLYEAARLQLTTLDLAVGAVDAAERVLAGVGNSEARAVLARCRPVVGDLDGAEREAHALLARDDDDVSSLDVLAVAAARGGGSRPERSSCFGMRSVDPFDGEAGRILAS